MSYSTLRHRRVSLLLASCLIIALSACATATPEPPDVSAAQDTRFRHAQGSQQAGDADIVVRRLGALNQGSERL